MDHDLRFDAEEAQHNLPVVGSGPAKAPDCTVWTQQVNQRLTRLEQAVEHIADHVQVLILRLDDGK